MRKTYFLIFFSIVLGHISELPVLAFIISLQFSMCKLFLFYLFSIVSGHISDLQSLENDIAFHIFAFHHLTQYITLLSFLLIKKSQIYFQFAIVLSCHFSQLCRAAV